MGTAMYSAGIASVVLFLDLPNGPAHEIRTGSIRLIFSTRSSKRGASADQASFFSLIGASRMLIDPLGISAHALAGVRRSVGLVVILQRVLSGVAGEDQCGQKCEASKEKHQEGVLTQSGIRDLRHGGLAAHHGIG